MQMNGGKLVIITTIGSKRTGMRPLTNLRADSFTFINTKAVLYRVDDRVRLSVLSVDGIGRIIWIIVCLIWSGLCPDRPDEECGRSKQGVISYS